MIVEGCGFGWYSIDGKHHSCHHYVGHSRSHECDCGAVPSHGVLMSSVKD